MAPALDFNYTLKLLPLSPGGVLREAEGGR
jgi:hypothetical protein